MLEHLRQQVCATLAPARVIVLSTWGPAGLQAAMLDCEPIATLLYIRILRTSDLLLNIERRPEVLATAAGWQLRGAARVLEPSAYPGGLALARSPLAAWSELVELRGSQLTLLPAGEPGGQATIDIW